MFNLIQSAEIDERFARSTKQCQDWCFDLRKSATVAKEKLMQTDFEELRKQSMDDFFSEVISSYQNLCFFPDDEILSVFKKLKITRDFLRWFVPLNEINEEIYKINHDSPITIFPYEVLQTIHVHIKNKIIDEIQQWGGLVQSFGRQKEKAASYIMFYNSFRRSKNSMFKRFPDFLREHMSNLLIQGTKYTRDEKVMRKILLDHTQGKIEKYWLRYLIQPVLDFIKINKLPISQRKALSYLYELCRIVLRDKELLSKEDFEKKDSDEYDRSFVKYSSTVLIKIFHLQEKFLLQSEE